MVSLTSLSAIVTAFPVVLTLGLVASTAHGQPTRAPDVHFVPTPMEVVDAMLAVARVTKDDRLFDLGSGDGRIVITAAKRLGTRGVGIDIDPQRITESRRNADTAGVTRLVEFRQADLFETDLREATVVTLYLLPRLNVQLRPKLFAELRPGSRVVSHSFDMGDWIADSTQSLSGRTGVLLADAGERRRHVGAQRRRGRGESHVRAATPANVPAPNGERDVRWSDGVGRRRAHRRRQRDVHAHRHRGQYGGRGTAAVAIRGPSEWRSPHRRGGWRYG